MVRLSVLILFLSLSTAANAIEVHGEFHAGYSPQKELSFTEIRIEFVMLSVVTLYGGWQTWFDLDLPRAIPYRDIYDVGARIDWRDLFLDINHACDHPVWSGQQDWLSQKWVDVTTTISLGVRW